MCFIAKTKRVKLAARLTGLQCLAVAPGFISCYVCSHYSWVDVQKPSISQTDRKSLKKSFFKKKKVPFVQNGTLVPTQLGAGTKKYQSLVYIPNSDSAQNFCYTEKDNTIIFMVLDLATCLLCKFVLMNNLQISQPLRL